MQTQILKTDSDIVKTEGANRYSRDEAVILSGSGQIEVGAVLGRITASGKYRPVTPGQNDGSQTAVAVSLQRADATAADSRRTVVLSRMADVVAQALVWPVGITTTQKTAALAQLETAGIVARRGV